MSLVPSRLNVVTFRSVVEDAGPAGCPVIVRASSKNDPIFSNTNGKQTIGVGLPQSDAKGNLDLEQILHTGIASTGKNPLPSSEVTRLNGLPQNEAGFVFNEDGSPFVVLIKIWAVEEDGEARYELVPS